MTDTPNDPRKPAPSDDLLLQRYQEANAFDSTRPGPALREAVLAHAKAHAPAPATEPAVAPQIPPSVAANDSQWKLRAFGSVAVLGLVGLLVMQFERGTPEEQAMALGTPGMRMESAQPQGPAAAAAKAETEAGSNSDAGNESEATGTREPMPAAPAKTRSLDTATNAGIAIAPAPASTRAIESMRLPEPMASITPMESMAPAAPAAPARSTEPMARAPEMAQADTAATPKGASIPESPLSAPRTPSSSLQRKESTATDEEASNARRGSDANRSSAKLADRSGTQPYPMHAAAQQGDLAAVRKLINNGYPLDGRDAQGRTPLMLAAIGHHLRVWSALVQAGADPHLTDSNGLSASDHADKAGHADWSLNPVTRSP